MRNKFTYVKGCRGRLYHCSERRKLGNPTIIGNLAKSSSNPRHVLAQGYHRDEDVNVLFPRKFKQGFKLDVQEIRVLQQQAHASAAEERIVLVRERDKWD